MATNFPRESAYLTATTQDSEIYAELYDETRPTTEEVTKETAETSFGAETTKGAGFSPGADPDGPRLPRAKQRRVRIEVVLASVAAVTSLCVLVLVAVQFLKVQTTNKLIQTVDATNTKNAVDFDARFDDASRRLITLLSVVNRMDRARAEVRQKACPEGFVRQLARCYYLQEFAYQQRTWTDAQRFCQTHNADLASLETPAEVVIVGSQFARAGAFHILSAKKGEDGVYRWLSGDTLSLDHPSWRSGRPSNGGEGCVAAVIHQVTGMVNLYDYNCTLSRPFVCESGLVQIRN